MRDDKLGIKQRAAMLALMAEAREVSNTELEEIAGFRLDGAFKRKLNELDLVTSRQEKRNKPLQHALTEKGWLWCRDELAEGPRAGDGSAGGGLYAVLAGLDRYLEVSGLRLRDVFKPVPEIERQIRAVYAKLAPEPSAWVGLAVLRESLNGASRADVDKALVRLNRKPDVKIIPEANQKVLTQQDLDAAIRIGDEDRHLIAIGA